MEKSLRIGLIGLGNIGKVHVANFTSGKILGGTLTAVCDTRPPAIALPENTRFFASVDEFLESGLIDAAIVAVPHPLHLEVGAKVLGKGLHLMMEKPLTATKLDGEKLLAVPRAPSQLFAIMMNLRTHPHYRRIKKILEAGKLGELQRVQWTITDWFRPDAYYFMSDWRATWKGEGGGVLINQALHNLDILQWLLGMPVRVRAHCRFGHEHDIEVEDHVVAFMEFANGATATFTTSTGEAPGVNRLEIAGTRGLIILENDTMRVCRNEVDTRIYSRTTENAFGAPRFGEEVFCGDEAYPSHSGVLNNFIEAFRGTAGLLADGREGLNSVELANAMLYSTWKGESVSLPLDSIAYEEALAKVISGSPPRKREVREAKVDMAKSF